MPQPKLTKQMIRLIIQLRDDETENWTYPKIQAYLTEHFNLSISVQSLRKSYEKNKTILSGVNSNDTKIKANTHQSIEPNNKANKKPLFKPKPQVASISEPIFEKDEDTDLQDYFN